jgi:hypothetical protein
MNRRQLLKLLATGVTASIVDPEQLLWTPNKTIIDLGAIYRPHPAQIAFINGIPYHESNATIGTWMGITRSTEPWPWKELLKKVMLDPKEPLYVIDSRRLGNDVGNLQEDGTRRTSTKDDKLSTRAKNPKSHR